MSDVFVYPLLLGTKVSNKSVSIIDHEPEEYTGAISAFCIVSADKNILVDTGLSFDRSFQEKYYAMAFKMEVFHPITEEQKLPNALKRIGLGIEDIDLVIITHTHFDHVGNLNLFPNTEIVIQRKELINSIIPNMPSFNRLRFPGPVWVEAPITPFGLIPMLQEGWTVNFRLVDGDQKITENVSVMLTPPHSLGLQSVIVRTNRGFVVLPSDNVPTFENWQFQRAAARYGGSKKQYLKETYESFRKIRELKPFLVLPSHDIKVFEKEKYP